MVSGAQSLLDINCWSLTGRSSSLKAWCGNFQSISFFISFLESCALTASVVKCQSIASIDPRLTLDQRLDWHPIDAQLTSQSILSNLDWPCQRSLDSYTNWQIVKWLMYISINIQWCVCKNSSTFGLLATEMLIKCWLSINWDVYHMSIKGQYRSTLNHRCL